MTRVVTPKVPTTPGEEMFDLTFNKIRTYVENYERSLFRNPPDSGVVNWCKHFNLPIDDRLRILMVGSEVFGCAYYRVIMPAAYLNKVYGNELVVATSVVINAELLRWADIVVIQRPANFEPLVILQRHAGDRIIVVENDDNLFIIPEDNASSRIFNKRSSALYFWMDALRIADAHQVSTSAIADFIRNYSDDAGWRFQQPVEVIPNSVDLLAMKTIPPAEERVAMGWQGSTAHAQDLAIIDGPVTQIQKEKPDVKFDIFGWDGMVQVNDERTRRYSAIPHVRVDRREMPVLPQHFMDVLARQHWSVALAPIYDYPFNHAKSNLRMIQYAAAGFPIVASDVGEYSKFVSAIHVDNSQEAWTEGIRTLLENPDAARELAAKAREEVLTYDIDVTVRAWRNWYLRLRGEFSWKLRNRIE